MSDRDELLRVFAAGILPKAAWIRDGNGSRRQTAAVRSSLGQEIRKLCDALGPEYLRPSVSRRAAVAAAAINVDLCAQTWQSQTKRTFDGDRAVFHLEHVVPVAAVCDAAIAVPTAERIVDVLGRLHLAWILKEENAALDHLGYRFRREDPAAAYAEAGIELIVCHP